MLDVLTQRTLGGILLRDHISGQPLARPMQVSSKTLRFARTLSGIYQIRFAPDFADYARAFETVPTPPVTEFSYEIHDDARQFLPVAASISLPRDAAPDAVTNRVDTPLSVVLPSAPGRPLTAGLTLCRVSVTDQNDQPVRGVLVQAVTPGTTDEIAWGLTAQNGEALIPILGIAILKTVDPGPDPDPDADEELTSSQTPVRLRLSVASGQPWPANIDTLRAGGGTIKTMTDDTNLTLTAGGNVHRALSFDLS